MGIGTAFGSGAAKYEKELSDIEIAQQVEKYKKQVAHQQEVDNYNINSRMAPTGNPSSKEDLFVYDEDHNLGKGLYNPYTKKYGTKATRNNNPGNITGMGGTLLYGASKIAKSKSGDRGDQAQLVFDDEASGWSAMYQLMKSEKYNHMSIREDFSKYQTDNDAWARIKDELTQRGVNIDRRFIDLTPEEQVIFMQNRAQHEGWKGKPLQLSMLSL